MAEPWQGSTFSQSCCLPLFVVLLDLAGEWHAWADEGKVNYKWGKPAAAGVTAAILIKYSHIFKFPGHVKRSDQASQVINHNSIETS